MARNSRKLRHDIAYIIFSAAIFIIKKTPRFLGLRLFGFLGFLFGHILKKEREITKKNLKSVFENYSQKQINRITNGVFVNAGKSFFDGIRIPEYSKEKFFKIVRLENENLTKEIFSNPNGTIILGSHLSAFELKTHIAAKLGFKGMSIGSRLFDKRIDKIFVNLRERNGVKYYERNGGMKNVLKNLKNGFNFGVLVDQDATNNGIFVNFLGKEAFTPSAPIKIAARYKIPLAWSFLIRENNDKYLFYIERAEIIETENETESFILNLEKFNDKLGEFIKKYPEQWVWMHRRWKREAKDFPPQLSISYYKEKEK
ncbi:MAG: lysophospholipid acyltransferase family protein [Chitinispirillales bacterium]|jgi:KDO2-lipid IV(A) lauroyltransferase|nr:lysophospholipid acyltransferase family protein [Chitinispirillales bacterium]